jgi:hypothetical protein
MSNRPRRSSYRVTSLHAQLRHLCSQVEQLEEQLPMREGEMNWIESTKSDICTEVVREIIELWRVPKDFRRYSNHMYYLTVVLLFRSPSTYDFLLNVFPFPSTVSVYRHFENEIAVSLNRLRSLDRIDPFFRCHIGLHPEILDGGTLTIDAISCSSLFVGTSTLSEITLLICSLCISNHSCPTSNVARFS